MIMQGNVPAASTINLWEKDPNGIRTKRVIACMQQEGTVEKAF
jgi:hypothetical protein